MVICCKPTVMVSNNKKYRYTVMINGIRKRIIYSIETGKHHLHTRFNNETSGL